MNLRKYYQKFSYVFQKIKGCWISLISHCWMHTAVFCDIPHFLNYPSVTLKEVNFLASSYEFCNRFEKENHYIAILSKKVLNFIQAQDLSDGSFPLFNQFPCEIAVSFKDFSYFQQNTPFIDRVLCLRSFPSSVK